MAQTEVSLSSEYKFSLDVLDFEYIKINHIYKDDRIKLLWDVRNRTQYYGFKIVAEKNKQLQSQNNEIFDETSIETCICYICNVCVPKVYIHEHYTSAKHKLCLEFMNKVLERARNSILNVIDVPTTKPPSNTYFCAPCSLAVLVNDKAKHENESAHEVSLKYDNVLISLVEVYNVNDKVKVDIEKTPSKTGIVTESDALNDKPTLTAKINKTVVEQVAHNTEEVELQHVKTDVIENTEENSPKIHYHFLNTENINEIKCKVCKVVVTFTEENVKIHMGGKKHKKKYNKIISGLKFSDDKFYCESCNVIVKENCEIEHMAEHVSLENLKTLQSQHVSKKLEQDNAYTDHVHIELSNGKFHCKVCNVGISNDPDSVKLHVDGLNHESIFHSLLLTNKLSKCNDVYYCQPCRVVILKDTEIIHVNSEKHKSNLNLTVQPLINPTVDQNQIAINSNKVHSAEKNVCSKTYINKLNNMKLEKKNITLSYINDDFVEILSNNMKVKVPLNNFHGFYESDGHTHCRLCEVPVDGTKDAHKLTDMHMQRVMMPIADHHCVREVGTWKHCILCNEIIENVYMHSFISHKHIMKLQVALLYSQLHRNVDTAESFSAHQTSFYTKIHCVVCSMDIDYHSYTSHLIGKSHISKYNTNFPLMPKPVDPESDDIENKIYHVAQTSNKPLKRCKTCNMYVTSNDLDSHLKGFVHRSNYHSMLIDNQMKTVVNGYYCDLCEVYVSKFNVADHASTQTHAIKIKSTTVTPKFHHTISVTNTVSCRVCEIILPYIPQEINEHLKDEDHINAYNTLLIANKLQKVDKRYACDCYVCEICDIKLMENEELDHILNDPNHKKKIGGNTIHPHMKVTDEPNIWLCKICKIKVLSITANITQHVKNYRHIAIHKVLIGSLKMFGDRYYCECCRGFIGNKQEIDHVLNTHVNADEHEKILQSYGVVENVVKPTNTVHQHTEVTNIVIPTNTVHQHMEVKGAVLHCRVCNVPVPNNTNCVKMHVNGFSHKTNFNELITSNKIVKHDDRYFCEICRVYNANGAEVPHLFSDKHKNARSTQPSGSNSATDGGAANGHTCIICSVKVPNNAKNIEEHNKSSEHNANLKKIAQCYKDETTNTEGSQSYLLPPSTKLREKPTVVSIGVNHDRDVRDKQTFISFVDIETRNCSVKLTKDISVGKYSS